MALPMLLGSAAKGLVKGGGRAAASKIMGRKKTVKATDIKPQTAIVPKPEQEKTRGALVKSPTAAITKSMAPIQQVSTGAVAKDDYLGIIHEKVLAIEKIVTGVYKAEKDNLKAKKQAEKDDARKNQEQKLETKDKKPDKKKPKLADLPKVGVFGWLKRFIGSILMGLFLQKMVDFAGFLPAIVRTIDGVTSFIADWGGKIVGALITFVDFGIKAYDFTIGAISKLTKSLFGANADKVLGLIDTALFLTTAIAGAMAAEALMGGGDSGGGPTTGIQGAAGQAGRVTKRGTTAAAARRYASRFGRDAAVQRFGADAVKSLGGKYARSGLTNFARDAAVKVLGKRGAANAIKTAAGVLKPLVKNVPLIGGIMEFVLSWISGDPVGKAAFKGVGAGLGTWIGGALGTLIPIPGVGTAIGMFLGGTGGSALGGVIYDAIFGGKAPQPSTTDTNYQEGGAVEGRPKGKVKRGIDIKKKKRRKLRVAKPTIERLDPLPPVKVDSQGEETTNNKAWWDFLGWFGGNQEPLGAGGKKLAEKTTDAGNKLGENEFFGPILRITSKVILDEEITARDYKNIGVGINYLLHEGIVKGKIGVLGYQDGGLVDNLPELDVTNWVSKTFEQSLEDDLKKKYLRPTSSKVFGSTYGPGSAPGERDTVTGELTGGIASGAISPSELYKKIGANAEQWDIFRNSVALIESGGKYDIPGGSGMHYDGRYQMGAAAKKDGARYAGVDYPGHSDDPNAQVRAAYRANKELQEAIFTGFTLANHTYLMRNETYKNSTIERKLQILGYAHNQGMGGAENWITTGVVGADGFGTKGTKYTDLIAANFRAQKAGGDLQIADNAISVPSLPDKPGSAEDTSGGGDIKVSGSSVVNIGKDLISKGFSVAEHPDFTKTPTASGGTYTPGKGSVSNVHKGRGHYEGRAIDVTDWRGSLEDSKGRYRSVLTSLQDNPAIKMLIHDSWGGMYAPGQKQGPGRHGHPTHMHIEVKDKGGFIGKGLFANLGGTEFVTDADSTAALKQVAPGLMMGLNQARDKSGVESVLKQYASYEQGAQQTVMMQDDDDEEQQQDSYGGRSSSPQLPPMMGESSNPFEFLEYQG